MTTLTPTPPPTAHPALAPRPHATPKPPAALQPTLQMLGTLDRCVLLSYRTPANSVQHLLPPGLELIQRGPYAFWNVVLCHVHKMRPLGVPEPLGLSYHHVAYRLMAQAMTDRADTRKGLYFVRSDADATLINTVGNRLSDFNFHHAKIDWQTQNNQGDKSDPQETIAVQSADRQAHAKLTFQTKAPEPHPADSCFPTARDAHEALKYQPTGLAINPKQGTLKLAEVFRDETQWREQDITVTDAQFDFFQTLGQTDVKLEHATQVAPLPYRWRLGKREPLLIHPKHADA